jgi:hypothetical protein
MPGRIHTSTSLLGRATPRQEYHTVCPLLRNQINDLLREALPALAGVAIGFMRSDGQARVE